jgi:hypothetical protein
VSEPEEAQAHRKERHEWARFYNLEDTPQRLQMVRNLARGVVERGISGVAYPAID